MLISLSALVLLFDQDPHRRNPRWALLCTFLEPESGISLLLNGQFLRNFVLTLIGGSGTFFFKNKRSNKVETVQHFKLCLLMNKSENFKVEPKSSEAQKIRKSLYATGHMRQYLPWHLLIVN